MENDSLLVDVRGSKTALLKLLIIFFRPRLSQKKSMQFYLEFEIKLPTGDAIVKVQFFGSLKSI